jgi:PAS domain S-box-containing protein
MITKKEKNVIQRSSVLFSVIASVFILSYFLLPSPFSIEWVLPFYVAFATTGMYYITRWLNAPVSSRETSYKMLFDKLNTTIWKLDVNTLHLQYVEGSLHNMEAIGIYDKVSRNITNYFTPDSCHLIEETLKSKLEEWKHNNEILPITIDCQMINIFGNSQWVALDMCFIPLANMIAEVIIVQRDIDAKKKEELQMLSHSDILHHLCNSVKETLWVIDFQTLTFRYINKNSFEIYGLFPDEMLDKPLKEFVHQEIFDMMLGIMDKVITQYKQGLRTDLSETFVTKFYNVNLNKYIDVEISARLTMDAEGNFKNLVGITKLMGDKLDTIKEMSEKINLFNLIEKNVIDDIFIMDYYDRTYKYVSSGFSRLTGVSAHYAVGEKCSKYVEKYSYMEVEDKLEREVLRWKSHQIKEIKLNTVVQIVHSSGRLIPTEIVLSANISKDGNIDYVIGIARNIENRIISNNARNVELSRIANITESSLDVLWSMDVKTMRYSYVSPASLLSLGYTPSEMEGALFTEFVSQDTAENFHKLLHNKLEEALEKGTRPHISIEIQMYHKMGYTVWVELSVTNLKGGNESLFEIVGTTKRIDNRKNAELQLAKQQSELQKLADTRDKFFGVIGHDIKNPVSALMNTAELLEENYENMDKAMIKKQMRMIIDSADHLYRLLDNLLQWSKHTAGEIPYRPNKCNIADIVMDATNHLKQQALYKDITINYKFETFGNNDVICDENMIRVVIINLVSNAIKYSRQKSLVEVLVRSYENDKRFLEIVVIDFGIGMNQERLSKIFHFKKNDCIAGTNNEPGAGLGLILCKEFIDKHNSFIWVKSGLEKGSQFHFTLLKG